MKPIFSHFRSTFGHICLSYIDDSLYIGNTAKECAEATLHAVQLLTRLGFNVNSAKSVLRPSQYVELLRFIIDSVTMTVYLTPGKRDKISSLCPSFLSPGKQFTIRQVASFTGKTVSAFPGVEFGPLHYRHLLADQDNNLRLSSGNFDAKMSLSPPSLLDVRWWADNINTAVKQITRSTPEVVLHTDASGVGGGATIAGGAATAGIWSQSDSLKHINVLELLTIKLAFCSLFNLRTGIHVEILCDNMTAVNYITAMGGTRSAECNALASDTWQWAITRNIWLSGAHIPGVSNVAADSLSR